MKLRQIAHALAVSRHGGFRRAAELFKELVREIELEVVQRNQALLEQVFSVAAPAA